MNFGISGKRALVLGASRGLGRACALALAAEGVTVWGAARTFSDAAGVSDGITPIHVDFGDHLSVAALKRRIGDEGGVDILINNTGGPKPGSAQTQTLGDWRTAFETLALPVFDVTSAALPFMLEKGWGRIITIGSSGIVQPIGNLVLSNAIRGAIAGWSKTLAGEVAQYGVTVNMVLPGRIDTDRVKQLNGIRSQNTGQSLDQVREASRRDIPANRYGRPEEFGETVAFLASANASYITGSMISVDGGLIRAL